MGHPSSDRNLLLGLLALRVELIRRDHLVAALRAGADDRSRPLGEILVEQQALRPDQRELLEALVDAYLEQHGHDAQVGLAALGDVGPIRQDLEQLADPDVQASLIHVLPTDLAPGHAPDVPIAGPPPAGRFLILRPHARGGLGEVFLARDEELQREVALKQIQHQHADQPESRARFLLEAEVTGNLEHPGIVPVYGLGTYADGRPFYAMRFIRGESLAHAIRAFHDADRAGRSASERSLALRQLLGRFLDVCNAIAYAHSRGVLHRDLKPGNVMLGQFGETLVVDWGLAKVLDRADAGTAEGTLRPSLGGDASMTQTGAALGTPPYMSPEQAAGRVDLLGPRSDVYSLGATLYCLLTGRAPFTDRDMAEVLAKVRRGAFLPPRQVNRKVPPALDAVCMRAMALLPEDRYATPRELAEEIERWLADEPVRAHREPLTARLGRWVRRHQALAVGIGVLLLTGFLALTVSTVLVSGALRKEEQARRERGLAQVDALLSADAQAVPALLANLEPTRDDVLPRLRELWEEEPSKLRRGRAGLALLPVEPERVRDWLVDWMLQADDPHELLLLREELRPHGAELRGELWQRAVEAPPEERFRALAALARFDPDNRRWPQQSGAVLEPLLSANPLHLGAWADAFRPVRAVLVQPLTKLFHAREHAEQRTVAATLLADYAGRQPEVLTELALEADPRPYAVLLPRLKVHAETVLSLLLKELARKEAKASEEERDRLALRQANAAMTLLHLGKPEPVWRLLVREHDPSRRTYLVHHLGPCGIDAAVLLDRLQVETDVSARRALLLSLGEYAPSRLPLGRREKLLALLVRDYRDDPDPGIHGVIEWLLRQWQEEERLPSLHNHRPKTWQPGKPTWHVNGQGQTFAVIPGPVEFLLGSPESEPEHSPIEVQHRRMIPRSFALATRPVTVAEFRLFLVANLDYYRGYFGTDGQAAGFLRRYSPAEDGPIILIDWYTAAAYCNWLSEREGLPQSEWCYPKDPGKIKPGMVMEEGHLRRKGYRLPTEAEREYACRAGAETSRPYGRSDALLGKYAWYQGNSGGRCHPAGRLRPNDLGLFDMLGNVVEWCQDRYGAYPVRDGMTVVEDREDRDRSDAEDRVVRGGAFDFLPPPVRCAQRGMYRPGPRLFRVGFRVARTCD